MSGCTVGDVGGFRERARSPLSLREVRVRARNTWRVQEKGPSTRLSRGTFSGENRWCELVRCQRIIVNACLTSLDALGIEQRCSFEEVVPYRRATSHVDLVWSVRTHTRIHTQRCADGHHGSRREIESVTTSVCPVRSSDDPALGFSESSTISLFGSLASGRFRSGDPVDRASATAGGATTSECERSSIHRPLAVAQPSPHRRN